MEASLLLKRDASTAWTNSLFMFLPMHVKIEQRIPAIYGHLDTAAYVLLPLAKSVARIRQKNDEAFFVGSGT